MNNGSQYSLVHASAQCPRQSRHQHSHHSCSTCFCGQYVSDIGAAPIDRGYWFSGVSDVNAMRNKILTLCPASRSALLRSEYDDILVPFNSSPYHTSSYPPSNRTYTVVIYQRNTNRMFLHMEHILRRLSADLGPAWRFELLHHAEKMEPCLLSEALRV